MILALIQSAPEFKFDSAKPLMYVMKATFDGFLPLFGGNEGKVVVDLEVPVTKLKPEKDGTIRLEHELSSAKIVFNDAPLPLTVENLRNFFPKTQVTINSRGETLKTTAPNVMVPVRLPGLDVKRLADLVYLPVVFPETELTKTTAWGFKKPFGNSDVLYTCAPKPEKDGIVPIDVTLQQSYTILEDEAMQETTVEKDAVNRVTTTMSGGGLVDFDPAKGLFRRVSLTADALSKVKDIKTGTESDRKLKITFLVTLKS